jgi:hypothetical protein
MFVSVKFGANQTMEALTHQKAIARRQFKLHIPHTHTQNHKNTPLWPSMRMGCARFQLGKVLVEKRLCTKAMKERKLSCCRSLK